MPNKLKKIKIKYYTIPVQARAAFWFLFCSVLQRGISVLTTPIFTRILGTGDYGQYTVFNSWLDVVSIFVTFRIYYGVFVQGLVKFNDDKDRYASSMQGLGLILSLSWTVIYYVFHNFWNALLGLTTVQMLAMLVMIWAAGAFRFWASTQRNEYKYKVLVIVTLIVSILKPAVSVALVLNLDDKVTARILGLAIVELIGYCWCFFVQMRKGKCFYSAKYWKHALMFNIPLIPHYLSQAVLSSADRIMIKEMIGVSEAGIYGLAYSISKIMSMINQALTQTFSPYAYQKIKKNHAEDLNSVVIIMLVIVAGANIMLISFAPEIVSIFAPKSYRDAIWVIPPVAMSVFFMFSYNLFALVEFYYERTKIILCASVMCAGFNVFLNYIFINRYGYIAAAYTTLVCYIAYALFHYLAMRIICKKEMGRQSIYDSKKVLEISVIFMIVGFAFLFSYKCNYVRWLMIAIIAVLCVLFRKTIVKYAKSILEVRRSKKQIHDALQNK